MIYAILVEYDDEEMGSATVILKAADNTTALELAIEAGLSARSPAKDHEIKGVSVISAWTDTALDGEGKLVF